MLTMFPLLAGWCFFCDPLDYVLPIDSAGWRQNQEVVDAIAALPNEGDRATVVRYFESHRTILPGTTIRRAIEVQVSEDRAASEAKEKAAAEAEAALGLTYDWSSRIGIGVTRIGKKVLKDSASFGQMEVTKWGLPFLGGSTGFYCGLVAPSQAVSSSEVSEYTAISLTVTNNSDSALDQTAGCLVVSGNTETCRFKGVLDFRENPLAPGESRTWSGATAYYSRTERLILEGDSLTATWLPLAVSVTGSRVPGTMVDACEIPIPPKRP